jgi:quinol-cytochrome oxidoreductase complex cytochrome b subunit
VMYNRSMYLAEYNNLLRTLPVPSCLSYNYSLGSLLGFIIVLQVLVGLVLFIHYSCSGLVFSDLLECIRSDYVVFLIR